MGVPCPHYSRRRQQIQDDFYPDETGLDKAREKGLSVAVQLTKFVDYHVGKGSVMADWQAAWRTWIGNARPDGPNAARPKYAAAAAAIFDNEPTHHPETIDV